MGDLKSFEKDSGENFISMDFSKVFDKVMHDTLVGKVIVVEDISS